LAHGWSKTRRGQFHRDGAIVPGGKIQVSGPVDWESDEAGAVVHAMLTQQEASASGDSAYTPATADTWFATLSVESGKFHNGEADALGLATVTISGGQPEEYRWPDQVVLHGG
jgi:hypothetical protein